MPAARTCGLTLRCILDGHTLGLEVLHQPRLGHQRLTSTSFIEVQNAAGQRRAKAKRTSWVGVWEQNPEPEKPEKPEDEKVDGLRPPRPQYPTNFGDDNDEKPEAEKEEEEKEGGDDEDIGKEHGGNEKIGSVSVEDVETLDLGPESEALPLCEDLNHDTVHMGESCWSTCEGQCPNDVLAYGEGLAFDFDEVAPGHPGCTSHFECIGNHDRQICHAVEALEDSIPPWFTALVTMPTPSRAEPSRRLTGSRAAGCPPKAPGAPKAALRPRSAPRGSPLRSVALRCFL
mmetsp:Transcript_47699/g.82951  ORF Transcript_47699/g.82951 Transcript_47699/m.82951 type:complete len:287 (-) Transcript_47699:8-868(-)